ncbi:MAG: alkylhydroperoxidase AhpD family core protein [Myxococcales bacterium]|nr:alkylhydroperoxidase AhpD family core protein [Myxococcales bacterium]
MQAYGEADKVAAVLADLDTAPIDEKLRLTLRMLRTVTTDHASVTPATMRALLDAGVSREQIEDALAVCFAFNVIDRLADTFEFEVPGPEAFAADARQLLKRGYKL